MGTGKRGRPPRHSEKERERRSKRLKFCRTHISPVLTQPVAALLAGVDLSTFQKWEQGQHSPSDDATEKAIAEAYGCRRDEFDKAAGESFAHNERLMTPFVLIVNPVIEARIPKETIDEIRRIVERFNRLEMDRARALPNASDGADGSSTPQGTPPTPRPPFPRQR